MNFYKNKVLILILGFFLLPYITYASSCSSVGYTVYTINGVNNTRDQASKNKFALENNFPPTYNNQPLNVDFLYNQTHVLGIDELAAKSQIYFDQENFNVLDSNFGQIMTDASQKLTTQKVLLVGHSQGNFYANDFYDTVADEAGGIPSQSIGVYAVATPSNHVAGGGLYQTSGSDVVIKGIVSNGLNAKILPANVWINFKPSDDNGLGHYFSEVYLKYDSDQIVRDIKTSLNKLQNNNVQKENAPCINPPKLTIAQKVQGVLLAAIDGSVNGFNSGVTNVENSYMAFLNGTGSMLANIIGSLAGKNPADVVAAVDQSSAVLPVASANTSGPKHTDNYFSPPLTIEIPDTNISSAETTPPSITLAETQVAPMTENIVTKTTTMDLSGLLPGGGGTTNTTTVTPPPPSDVTPPVVTLTGSGTINLHTGDTYTEQGAIATDDVDTLVAVVITGSVDTSAVGTYTIHYNATDTAGNHATEVTRTVNVQLPLSADYLDTIGNLVNGNVIFFNPAFDTPSNTHVRVWYQGNYPDISHTINPGNFLTDVISQTLPCGVFCGVSTPTYFWVGVYTDMAYTHLVHYAEVHYTGTLMDQANHYDITAQGNLP